MTAGCTVENFSGPPSARPGAAPLSGDSRHFAKAIVCEILSLPVFDRLQNQAGDEFGLIAVAVIGGRPAAGRTPHPVLAEVRRRDKRVDFTDGYAILLQFGACREAEA